MATWSRRGAPEIKRANFDVTKVTVDGRFCGYASLFNVADLGNDVVMPGAFKKSLERRGAQGIKLLWQHEAREPIGKWISIIEDSRGLKVSGQLNLKVARAREILSLIQDGAVDGLSIGFRTQRAQKDALSGLRRLYNIDLWEISLVTFPMQPQARVGVVDSFVLNSSKALSIAWRIAAKNLEIKIIKIKQICNQTKID